MAISAVKDIGLLTRGFSFPVSQLVMHRARILSAEWQALGLCCGFAVSPVYVAVGCCRYSPGRRLWLKVAACLPIPNLLNALGAKNPASTLDLVQLCCSVHCVAEPTLYPFSLHPLTIHLSRWKRLSDSAEGTFNYHKMRVVGLRSLIPLHVWAGRAMISLNVNMGQKRLISFK